MSFSLRSESISVANFTYFGFSACDDAKIRIWTIPEDGIDGTLTKPSIYLKGS